jgi:hypothetical protein
VAASTSTSTIVSPVQLTSTLSVSSAPPTVISSTQYPSGSTIAVNLAISEAITSQDNDGFIPVEEPEAAQVVQAGTMQQKKRGRPRGSKDKQPRKRRTIDDR